jgi:quercetin dioxygenase-like cupin family protein
MDDRKEKRMAHTVLLLSLSLLFSVGAFAIQAEAAAENKKSQTIAQAGSQPSAKGPAEWFTGDVRIDPIFPANESAPFSGAYVTLEPGARSAWHIHPTGQHLIVTSGVGRTQEWGGPIEEIKAGDVIWCPPGVKRWHGASPTTAMTHMAITGTLNGKNVEWMEKVTDEQYNGK